MGLLETIQGFKKDMDRALTVMERTNDNLEVSAPLMAGMMDTMERGLTVAEKLSKSTKSMEKIVGKLEGLAEVIESLEGDSKKTKGKKAKK